MIYLMATDSAGVPVALNILAEAVLRPEITEEEVRYDTIFFSCLFFEEKMSAIVIPMAASSQYFNLK